MAGLWKKLEELLGGGPGGTKRVQIFRLLVLIGLIGGALMIANSFLNLRVKDVAPNVGVDASSAISGAESKQTFLGGGGKEKSAFRDYEQAYESQLKEILQKIVGVGEVEVLVTIESTEEVTVEKNSKDTQQVTNEKDQNGSTRHITDVTRSGEAVIMTQSGNQTPLVLKYVKPKIRGVVVVAKGAENLTVKKLLLEAVERGLDVPPHRISIVPRKQ